MASVQAELAVRVLNMATFAHLEHFKTSSYSAHKALESLYNDLPDAIDGFIELYQGINGKITSYPALTPMQRPCAKMCSDLVDWIDANWDELTDDDESLENSLAEIRSLLLRAMYRLNELS